MADLLAIALFFGAYYVLLRYLLPYLGVPPEPPEGDENGRQKTDTEGDAPAREPP